MPIYEYRCESCGRQHEALQKLSDKPLKACPSCGKRALKRLMSAPRFRLKGEGWYETDFKSDKDKKRNLADSGGDGATASAGDSTGSSTGEKSAEKSSDKSSEKSGEKAAEKKVDKSEAGDKPSKPAAAKADGKVSARPRAVRKPTGARRRPRRRS